LVRELSLANPIWGAPRIHGELLKLGIEVAQSTVAKYMAKRMLTACLPSFDLAAIGAVIFALEVLRLSAHPVRAPDGVARRRPEGGGVAITDPARTIVD